MRDGRRCVKIPVYLSTVGKGMGKRLGYARVSTDDQRLDLQRDALTRAGCVDIYEETVSGKSTDRPVLDYCLRALNEGDTLVVWRLDRLGRSLPDLVRIVGELERRSIGFGSGHRQVWLLLALVAAREDGSPR